MRRFRKPRPMSHHVWDPCRETRMEFVQMASDQGLFTVIGITDGGLSGCFLIAEGECAHPQKARSWAQQLVRGPEPYDSAMVIDGMGNTLFHTDDSVQ